MAAAAPQDHLDQLAAAVRAAGGKLTHQRLEILRELVGNPDHPDAEAVFRSVVRRVPTISLDTVYRTLWRLVDLGVISTLGPRRDSIRFDPNTAPHHHFVCERCGSIRDFHSPRLTNLPLPPEVATLGTVTGAQVEVRGVCTTCARASAAPRRRQPRRAPKESS
ncbi:MAG: transcriptional repressor [Kofleriaceae bacterium]